MLLEFFVFFNFVAFSVLLWAAIRRQKCVDIEIQLWQKLNHTKSIRRTVDITIQIINFDDSNANKQKIEQTKRQQKPSNANDFSNANQKSLDYESKTF